MINRSVWLIAVCNDVAVMTFPEFPDCILQLTMVELIYTYITYLHSSHRTVFQRNQGKCQIVCISLLIFIVLSGKWNLKAAFLGFCFLIQLLIRMMFISILYKIFLTLTSFIRYKVTVMVLICFVFPSWITNEFFEAISNYHYDNSLLVLQCISYRLFQITCQSTFWDVKNLQY